jgi:hypothetical protein
MKYMTAAYPSADSFLFQPPTYINPRWECESYQKKENRDFAMDFFQQPFIKSLLPAGDIMEVGSLA